MFAGKMKVEFYKHNLTEVDISNAINVLRSPFLTTGQSVSEFEHKFSNYIGIPYTVGLSSCTAALHLALISLGIGVGDEVITTPMTFIATANSILMVGAKPVFVDVERETGNINADLIEEAITDRTKAIMPVHLYGQLCDMAKIHKIADKYGLRVIEDSAHAIDAQRQGIRVGLSDISCFSFYATKQITSGEGGALCTRNPKIYEFVRKLRLHGMSKSAEDRYRKYEHYDMEVMGWKYNMDNIHASLLINQIGNIDIQTRIRERICYKYEQAFSKIKGIRLLKTMGKSSRHLFTILVKNRDKVLRRLQERGIGVSVNYKPVHLMSYYRKIYDYKVGDCPVAEMIGDSTITLPLYSKLTNKEIGYIIKSVKECV